MAIYKLRRLVACSLLIVSLVVVSDFANAQHQVFDKSKLILEPFDYHEGKLQDSHLKRQCQEVEAYYLAISNDDLLKGFRERAGLPTNGGKDLGGWYSRDLLHVFGQFLGGMSRLYAVSGNEAMKTKVNTLIAEWAKTIEADGYFFYSRKTCAPHYVYEKITGGLVDAYLFTGNKDALKHLSTITDWALKNLNRERIYGQPASEWYTMTENLYRAYQVTKDEKYLEFGKFWEYPEYWNVYANNGNMFDKQFRHHAYSHLNTLSGAAAAYLVRGEEHYKTIIKNAYDYFQNEQCFATGGVGPTEKLLPKENLINTLQTTHHSFETQCGSWAIFKLSKYLIEITGDAKYGDWIEKMTINGIGADIPMSSDGKVLYYTDYNPIQGTKHNYHEGWSCCTGTRPQAVAEYANLVYFKGKDGLYVNLYTPSEIEWNGLTVKQQTRFPESNQSEFTLNLKNKRSNKVMLSFRNPSWAASSPIVSVNGKQVKPVIVNNWMQLDRQWQDGDKIKIEFPLQLKVDRLHEENPFPAALVYGPVAMAVNVADAYPADIVDVDKVAVNFSPVPGKPLNFKVKNHPELILRPYYQFGPNEPYRLYVDPAVKNFVPEKYVTFTGEWKLAKGPHFSNDQNAKVSTQFIGKGVAIYMSGFQNSGKAKIEIDGKLVEIIDTYNPDKAETPIEKVYNNLPKGKHEVVVSVLNEKNQESKGTFVNFTTFKVLE